MLLHEKQMISITFQKEIYLIMFPVDFYMLLILLLAFSANAFLEDDVFVYMYERS
jgi:hypothetical protein